MIEKDELRELYQEFILDHGKHPRNCREPNCSNRSGEGYNPLCGDRITLKLEVDDGVIKDIGFLGQGCAISTAAASTMTEAVMGKTVDEARDLFDRFHRLVTGGEEKPDFDQLGKLSAFGGVAEFPMRVKCATLAWHTLQAALEGDGKATTE
jgi:nitrogen fixation NifU-like protein